MTWAMKFGTASHEDLEKHAAAYAATLDERQAAQVQEAVAKAVAKADELGLTSYTASLSGHAGLPAAAAAEKHIAMRLGKPVQHAPDEDTKHDVIEVEVTR